MTQLGTTDDMGAGVTLQWSRIGATLAYRPASAVCGFCIVLEVLAADGG